MGDTRRPETPSHEGEAFWGEMFCLFFPFLEPLGRGEMVLEEREHLYLVPTFKGCFSRLFLNWRRHGGGSLQDEGLRVSPGPGSTDRAGPHQAGGYPCEYQRVCIQGVMAESWCSQRPALAPQPSLFSPGIAPFGTYLPSPTLCV